MEAASEYGCGGYVAEKKAACGDHFVVEDLLDFSNEEEEDESPEVGAAATAAAAAAGGDDAAGRGNLSAESSTVTGGVDSCSNSFSGGGDSYFAAAGFSGDLCEPYDQLAELEWLSNFTVEESFSSEDLQKLHLISGIPSAAAAAAAHRATTTTTAAADPDPEPGLFRSEAPVPGKARSKRSRAAPCSWSSRLLVLSPASPPTPTAISIPSPEHGSIATPALPLPVSGTPKKASAKLVKKKDPTSGPAVATAPDGRRCLHCETDKTPQWRTGPMGPKTLCNACGVRYKSGRLVPEYRPAASPTFIVSKHSNSHRKVLELRRQKELQQHQQLMRPGGGGQVVFEAAAPSPAVAGDDFLIHHRIGTDFRQLI